MNAAICRVRVNGECLLEAGIGLTHGLFEYLTSQPGKLGYNLAGIERLIGRSFTPRPGQYVELINFEGEWLALGKVPAPNLDAEGEPWPFGESAPTYCC